MNLKALGAVAAVLVGLPAVLCSVKCACFGAVALAGFVVWLVKGLSAPPGLKPDRPKRALLHDKFSEDKLPPKIDAIVIGSGMGGLSTAAILARTNKRVLVLEQHPDMCGGTTHSYNLNGYKFDSGLHYSVPWNGPLLQLTCLKKEAEVPSMDLMGDEDGAFDYIYMGDGSQKPFPLRHKEAHLSEIYKMFPEEKKAIDKYLELSEHSITMSKVILVTRLCPKWLQPYVWKLVPKSWLNPQLETSEQVLDKLTDNTKLKSLLCSMWIDSGGRPDEATFMMTSCVFRGLPREGGCYPRGGPEALAAMLVETIEEWGGRVLIDARVGEINMNDKKEACGVTLGDGTVIEAPIVISGAGYNTTFSQMVPKTVREHYKIPDMPVKNGAGFVMANIGLKGAARDLGITNTNLWYLPTDKDGNMFNEMRAFYADPLSGKHDPPIMFTFPSVKDTSLEQGAKTTVQILLCIETTLFEEWQHEPTGKRGDDYDALKKKFEDMLLAQLYKFYPKTKEAFDFIDISTPLTVNHYLNSVRGSAIGLDITADRFFDQKKAELFDPVTRIPNLFITGQDTVLPGVVMAQLAGVITAFRICGLVQSAKFVLQSVFLL